jgi:hypothetical protein
MFWQMKSTSCNSAPERLVVPLLSRAHGPLAAIDLWIVAQLQACGPMTLSDLVLCVADRMYHDALFYGAAAVDIGLFGAKLFHTEAAAVVTRGDEKWWVIDQSGPRVASAAVTEHGSRGPEC